ncbi:chromosome segregation protein SMC [Halalkalibacillus halophilus]|uniref:chromosome segregation protein SMC n=1 Tax=Halalkalibacillus halophilus TaxID=392827 RepID=UPI0003F910BA|nr:chromosome segregation protein SMC [Halalkalibacillus halophilus]
MFLKKLESVGFKSFAERIAVDFVPGVTAVVGPNGSGKSNITDAIRWVLGEQSAKSLRGSKMEDIIFAGSDTRKALNVADVTLVLDNEDRRLPIEYEEVAITRRVYRSGDSEYLINQQTCRLKDITELFMDSGLGKEAFSIISQGKVEEILSSKSEERRSIFEEAAGVLKYKQRKVNAQKKLTDTEENLNRVEDIIHEIEGQLTPLKEQAETAKSYLKMREELKHYEVALLVTEIESLHLEWDESLKASKEVEEEITELDANLEKEEHQVYEQQKQLQHIDENLNRLQDNKLQLTKDIEQTEGKKNVLTERLKHYDESKDKLLNAIQSHQDQIDQLEFDLDDYESKLQFYIGNRDETKQYIESLEKRVDASGDQLETKLEELKAEYIDLLNEQAAKKNEKQSTNQQIEQISHRKERLDLRFQGLVKDREELEQAQEEKRSELSKDENQFHMIQTEVDKLKVDLETKSSTLKSNQDKLQEAYRIIEQLKQKKDMLEDMKDSYSGYYYGVKAVLQANKKNQIDGIIGAVAESISIEEQYISAMETALGGQSQHLIVENDQAARQAIKWLKDTNNGRATFLPLTSVKEKFISRDVYEKLQSEESFVGVASDLVSSEAKLQPIVKYLLGNVIIATSLKGANHLAKISNHRFRIVTVDGDVVNPGGSMSGGAKKKTNQASLFTREKELEDVKEKLLSYEERTIQFNENVRQEQMDCKTIEDEIYSKEEQLQEAKSMKQRLEQEMERIDVQLDHKNEQLKMYDQENSQFDEDLKDLETKNEKLDKVLKEQHDKANELQRNISDLTENQSKYKEELEGNRSELHNYQIRLTEQENEVRNTKEKRNEVRDKLKEEKQLHQQAKEEHEQLLETQANAEKMEELTDELHFNREKFTEVNNEMEQTQQSRDELVQEIEDLKRENKEKLKQQEQKKQTLQKYEVQANRLDVALENRLQQLSDEYLITYEKALQDFGKTEDLESTKKQVNTLKTLIDQLGTVNIGSIDEYERIQERYSFLTEQQTDLLEAKQTLNDVISEMDEEMIRKFTSTFSQIQAEFVTVFKALFGGGNAELKLTNPDDLLETGVDIIAQPPGKKLQHLGLLSGGERALTAIALLFAILRVRPVPFCVLDEVEAALDEANVMRFAQYLKEFSKNTQFIVITHRKGTMEYADVLYGVTMQESGVSKMVSVKLEETDEMVHT